MKQLLFWIFLNCLWNKNIWSSFLLCYWQIPRRCHPIDRKRGLLLFYFSFFLKFYMQELSVRHALKIINPQWPWGSDKAGVICAECFHIIIKNELFSALALIFAPPSCFREIYIAYIFSKILTFSEKFLISVSIKLVFRASDLSETFLHFVIALSKTSPPPFIQVFIYCTFFIACFTLIRFICMENWNDPSSDLLYPHQRHSHL